MKTIKFYSFNNLFFYFVFRVLPNLMSTRIVFIGRSTTNTAKAPVKVCLENQRSLISRASKHRIRASEQLDMALARSRPVSVRVLTWFQGSRAKFACSRVNLQRAKTGPLRRAIIPPSMISKQEAVKKPPGLYCFVITWQLGQLRNYSFAKTREARRLTMRRWKTTCNHPRREFLVLASFSFCLSFFLVARKVRRQCVFAFI